ncbi:MAG: metalloprotease [Firmicutes bacterium]|nr:metalloprotease [Bacillota bacterium]
MQVKPVRRYKTPKYPDKEETLKNPGILLSLPARWRNNAYVAVALSSLLLMTLTACSDKDRATEKEQDAVQVAPVFIRGVGRGSFGCVSVAPPAFLSEEEAFSVIQEEARREGIVFTKEAPVLQGVTLPETRFYYSDEEENTGKQKGDLVLDGYCADKKLAFEFVSRDDIVQWAKKNETLWSSVESYRFLEAAKILAQGLEGQTGGAKVAVFYDPHYDYERAEIQEIINGSASDFALMEEKLKERVKADLREQVRDFLHWLKGQNII